MTSASAVRNSARETITSIAFHTCETPGSSPGPPHPSESNSAATATASLADALASRGCCRAFSRSDSCRALPSISVVISRSSSSSASSTDLACRCRTVATSVASRRASECRRISEADAVIP